MPHIHTNDIMRMEIAPWFDTFLSSPESAAFERWLASLPVLLSLEEGDGGEWKGGGLPEYIHELEVVWTTT